MEAQFFCLAYVGQSWVPTTEVENDKLFEAGLGKKEIEFDRLDGTAEEFKEVLLESFAQLRDAHGYQLCKCMPNSHKLEPLSSRVMASPQMLHQRIGNTCIYIVPLQIWF